MTRLEVLPADGVPRKFPILADKTDAWNKYPNTPVGAVYLRRTGERAVQALNVVCPHTGCFVDYRAERKGYYCPCHSSSFAVDGRVFGVVLIVLGYVYTRYQDKIREWL